jgi:hypothetical protein
MVAFVYAFAILECAAPVLGEFATLAHRVRPFLGFSSAGQRDVDARVAAGQAYALMVVGGRLAVGYSRSSASASRAVGRWLGAAGEVSLQP